MELLIFPHQNAWSSSLDRLSPEIIKAMRIAFWVECAAGLQALRQYTTRYVEEINGPLKQGGGKNVSPAFKGTTLLMFSALNELPQSHSLVLFAGQVKNMDHLSQTPLSPCGTLVPSQEAMVLPLLSQQMPNLGVKNR